MRAATISYPAYGEEERKDVSSNISSNISPDVPPPRGKATALWQKARSKVDIAVILLMLLAAWEAATAGLPQSARMLYPAPADFAKIFLTDCRKIVEGIRIPARARAGHIARDHNGRRAAPA